MRIMANQTICVLISLMCLATLVEATSKKYDAGSGRFKIKVKGKGNPPLQQTSYAAGGGGGGGSSNEVLPVYVPAPIYTPYPVSSYGEGHGGGGGGYKGGHGNHGGGGGGYGGGAGSYGGGGYHRMDDVGVIDERRGTGGAYEIIDYYEGDYDGFADYELEGAYGRGGYW